MEPASIVRKLLAPSLHIKIQSEGWTDGAEGASLSEGHQDSSEEPQAFPTGSCTYLPYNSKASGKPQARCPDSSNVPRAGF